MVVELILGTLMALGAQAQEQTAQPTPASLPTTATEAQPDPDPIICRTRLTPSMRAGERYHRQQVCMTRSEWNAPRSRRR